MKMRARAQITDPDFDSWSSSPTWSVQVGGWGSLSRAAFTAGCRLPGVRENCLRRGGEASECPAGFSGRGGGGGNLSRDLLLILGNMVTAKGLLTFLTMRSLRSLLNKHFSDLLFNAQWSRCGGCIKVLNWVEVGLEKAFPRWMFSPD